MGVVLTIAWKEFRSFLNSPLAYIFLIIFVGGLAANFWIGKGTQGYNAWTVGQADLQFYFAQLPIAFVILVPALSMKLWPDELKSGTVELLMTYPLRGWQIVLGKYLAGLYLIALGLVLTLGTPLVMNAYGNLDTGPLLGAYVASFLLGGAFLAMGLFFGALCREQVTAFILTALFCGLLVALDNQLNFFLPKAVHGLARHLSFTTRFEYLGRGVVPLGDVLYYVLFAMAFLVLNVTVVECRKGR